MDKKTCRFCRMEIPKGARICPFCRKKQKLPLRYKILGIFVILFVIGIIQSIREDTSPKPIEKSKVEQKTELTPQELLKKHKKEVSEWESFITNVEKNLKKYYPTPETVAKLQEATIRLAIISDYLEKQKAEKDLVQKADSLYRKAEILRREAYAKSLEKTWLDRGSDIKVNARGAKKEELYIEWPLMSRVFVHKTVNNQEIREQLKQLGFTKILFKGPLGAWIHTLKESKNGDTN